MPDTGKVLTSSRWTSQSSGIGMKMRRGCANIRWCALPAETMAHPGSKTAVGPRSKRKYGDPQISFFPRTRIIAHFGLQKEATKATVRRNLERRSHAFTDPTPTASAIFSSQALTDFVG